MSVAWPLVKRRLLVWLPALPSWSAVVVLDGPPVTADVPTEYVTVGYVLNDAIGGDFEVLPEGVAGQQEETGVVRCELVCATGEVDLPAVEARAFDLLAEVLRGVRADQTLGVLPPSSTCSVLVDVAPSQTPAGAVQRLVLSFTYLSRGLT